MPITRDQIVAAAARIAPHVRQTPLWRMPSSALGLPAGAPPFEAWLKLEQLQVSGSFKARGMFNRLLSNTIPAAGVIAASGGNAGIATAVAAQALGVRAEIFVPSVISPAKRSKLAALGADVVIAGDVYADALTACVARQRETGALMTHAYDQAEVVAGAGTLAREIELQGAASLSGATLSGGARSNAAQSDATHSSATRSGAAAHADARHGTPDSVLVSVGGGGLVAGIAAWFAGRSRVIALEPELAPTLHSARAAGTPVDVQVSGIAADSLGARRIGAIAWQIAQQHVAQAELLGDAAIRDAQRFMWQAFRLAVEPAAALPLAALRSGLIVPREGESVCLIVCGANVDLATLA